MSGKRMVALEAGQNGGLWQATLQDASGKLSQVVWHPGRTMSNPWPVKKRSEWRNLCDLSGKCRSLAPDAATIGVDFRPVYLAP